jgi:hypothetical protein
VQKTKATDLEVTPAFLAARAALHENGGYPKARWIVFCETMLERGFTLTLYEARQTASKYLTVMYGEKSFKVRYSNHPPARERLDDCDFFVGRRPGQTTNTTQAIEAVMRAFGFPANHEIRMPHAPNGR